MPVTNRLRLTRRRVSAVSFILLTLACVPAYLSAYTVAGPSDAPTLLIGDRVLVNHAAYDFKAPYTTIRLARLGEPRRGDLVSVLMPNTNTLVLKRIAAVPGDTVEMRENRLFINGRQVQQEVLNRPDFDWIPPAHGIGIIVAAEKADGDEHRVTYTPGRSPLSTFKPMNISHDCFFVLGDNRDDSNDSRTFGPVGRDLISGRVELRIPAMRP